MTRIRTTRSIELAPPGLSKKMGRTGQAFMAAFALSFVFMYLS